MNKKLRKRKISNLMKISSPKTQGDALLEHVPAGRYQPPISNRDLSKIKGVDIFDPVSKTFQDNFNLNIKNLNRIEGIINDYTVIFDFIKKPLIDSMEIHTKELYGKKGFLNTYKVDAEKDDIFHVKANDNNYVEEIGVVVTAIFDQIFTEKCKDPSELSAFRNLNNIITPEIFDFTLDEGKSKLEHLVIGEPKYLEESLEKYGEKLYSKRVFLYYKLFFNVKNYE